MHKCLSFLNVLTLLVYVTKRIIFKWKLLYLTADSIKMNVFLSTFHHINCDTKIKNNHAKVILFNIQTAIMGLNWYIKTT